MSIEVTADVWYLKDPAQSLAYRRITYGPPTAAAVFPDDYEYVVNLKVRVPDNDPASMVLAAEIALANCQNGRWDPPSWEPATEGKRSMDIGDLVFINKATAFRIMDYGVIEVEP